VNGDHLGPVLTAVEPHDVEAVRALFAEQRARLAVVQQHRLWDWLGGVPATFAKPTALLHGLWAQLAGLALVGVALVAAGFTRGPVLWALLGAALLCFAFRHIVLVMPSRRAIRFYRRGVIVPAVMVGVVPDADPQFFDVRCVAALVAPDGLPADGMPSFVAAGDRLRRMLDGEEPTPESLQSFVATVRDGLRQRIDDGSRIAVPAELGGDRLELARFWVQISLLPGEELRSRLVFVLLDRTHRGRHATRSVQSSLWGTGVESLCEAFPLEDVA